MINQVAARTIAMQANHAARNQRSTTQALINQLSGESPIVTRRHKLKAIENVPEQTFVKVRQNPTEQRAALPEAYGNPNLMLKEPF